MVDYQRLADILLELECALREQDLWDSQKPSQQALSSPHPFCVDTLTFPQWLQFIFIPRIKWIIEEQQPLPANSEIVPMAQEWLRRSATPGRRLIAIIADFDAFIGLSARQGASL